MRNTGVMGPAQTAALLSIGHRAPYGLVTAAVLPSARATGTTPTRHPRPPTTCVCRPLRGGIAARPTRYLLSEMDTTWLALAPTLPALAVPLPTSLVTTGATTGVRRSRRRWLKARSARALCLGSTVRPRARISRELACGRCSRR